MKARVIGFEYDEQAQLEYVKLRFDDGRSFNDTVSVRRDRLGDFFPRLGDEIGVEFKLLNFSKFSPPVDFKSYE